MRFGLFGGPVRLASDPSDQTSYRSYLNAVIEADRLGYDGAYLVEHHFTGQGQVSASLSLLSHLAALTKQIRLGTAVVVVPWHNPVLLAEQAATVDLLSGGRLDLGLGRGYRDYEFEGFGVDRAEANSRFSETLEFLRMAWTQEGRFDFSGEHWSFKNVVIEPRPLQTPHPPLWTGAASQASIEFAATQGLRLFLDQIATFDEIEQRVKWYRAAQAAAGHPNKPNDIALTRPLLLTDKRHTREALLTSHLQTMERLASTARSDRNPFYSNPDERKLRAENGAVLGDAQECIERTQRIAECGVSTILFTRTPPNALRHFADQVMPAFSNAASSIRN